MLAGAHIIFGNAVALNLTQNPEFAFLIGLISHHIADFLPHLDRNIFEAFDKTNRAEEGDNKYKSPKEWSGGVWSIVIIEFVLGFGLFLLLAQKIIIKEPWVILFATVGALFSDIVCFFIPRNILLKFKFTRAFLSFHKKFHCHLKRGSVKNLLLFGVIEGVIIYASIIALMSL
ncbi:MAG: hypothetical protein AAB371_00550 [Patescibacteria group bacterium]